MRTLVGQMAVWSLVAAVFGLLQVWMGFLKCRSWTTNPRLTRTKCMLISLGDGNLFIFSTGTAGGVLAVALSQILLQQGGLHENRELCVSLILLSMFVIVFAALWWTNATKVDPQSMWINANSHGGIHTILNADDVMTSVRFAGLAFACAFIAEATR